MISDPDFLKLSTEQLIDYGIIKQRTKHGKMSSEYAYFKLSHASDDVIKDI